MNKEVWKDIPEYEGSYQASNKGRIRSLTRKVKPKNKMRYTVYGKIIKPYFDKDGYARLGLSKKGKSKGFAIHRLVGLTFIPNPEGKLQINHIDAIKDNNNVENLEWVTHQENSRHAAENGLMKNQTGKDNPNIKLVEEDVHLIRKLREEGKTLSEIAPMVKTSISNVKNVVYGYTWKWLKVEENET